jgi:hypothetical protein
MLIWKTIWMKYRNKTFSLNLITLSLTKGLLFNILLFKDIYTWRCMLCQWQRLDFVVPTGFAIRFCIDLGFGNIKDVANGYAYSFALSYVLYN